MALENTLKIPQHRWFYNLDFKYSVVKRRVFFYGSDKIVRDFIYIEDVIQANIKACVSGKSGVYNVGTAIPRSFQDIADILQVELGTNLGTAYFQNPYSAYQMHTEADITLTCKELDYAPQFSLEEGIKAYACEIRRIYTTEVKHG